MLYCRNAVSTPVLPGRICIPYSKIDTTPPPTQLPDFKYQQLPSARHVRLVHILKGPKDSPPNIRFTTAELAEGLLFETLSYVWGVKRHYRVNCKGGSLVIDKISTIPSKRCAQLTKHGFSRSTRYILTKETIKKGNSKLR